MAPSLTMPPSGAQFIFTMHKVSRFHPPDREVLKDITLSFYPGAKIGVLGPNGAGKSSLLRIMAGVDDGYTGEARLTPGFTVGLLEQEPQLDAAKDVIGNVMDGVGETAAAARPSTTRCWPSGPTPTPTTRSSASEQAELEKQIEAAGAWDLKRTIDDRHGRPAGASGRRRRHHPVGWRAAPGRAVPAPAVAGPTCCCSTSPPTTSTPSRWPGWSGSCGTTRAPSSPSPTTATSSTTWPAGSSSSTGAGASPSRATTRRWLEQKQARLAHEEKQDSSRQRTLERELEWVRMAPEGPAGQGPGPPRRLREAARPRRRRPRGDDGARDRHPLGRPARRRGDRGRPPHQGLRRPAADRGPHLLAPQGRHRRRHRRATARARPRCSG